MTGSAARGVRWIETLDEAAADGAAAVEASTDEATAWLVRWDDPRVDGWLTRSPPDPADLTRFAGRADAGRRIVRRRLARLLLSVVSGGDPRATRLVGGSHGAVAVTEPAGWHLSLAGSGGWCGLAIDRAPLGIDVETITGDPLPPDLLTGTERARLATTAIGERLAASLACWTGKEAHAKRFGHPREADPAGIETMVDGTAGEARSAAGISRLAFRRGDDWVAAVALQG